MYECTYCGAMYRPIRFGANKEFGIAGPNTCQVCLTSDVEELATELWQYDVEERKTVVRKDA